MIINTCRLKVMKIHRVEAVTMMAAPKTARMRRRLGSSPWLLSSEVELPFTALKSVTPGKKRDVVRPKILSWKYLNSWCQSLPNPSIPPAPQPPHPPPNIQYNVSVDSACIIDCPSPKQFSILALNINSPRIIIIISNFSSRALSIQHFLKISIPVFGHPLILTSLIFVSSYLYLLHNASAGWDWHHQL